MKVLIVDDSKAMRMIITRTLRQAGLQDLEIQEAAGGKEALEACAAEDFDVVLCDWIMPEVDGLEVLGSLRAQGSQVPFGFVTSRGAAESRSQALRYGASFLISKPFSAEVFRETLEGVVK